MANNIPILGTLAAFAWLFVNGPPPSTQPTARAPAPGIAAIGPSMPPSVIASSNSGLQARRDPVPLVRNVQVSSAPPASTNTPIAAGERQMQDDLDKNAAKAAVELDGYKGVTILGKATNGAWRARGLRGATEVLLTVDGTGRVSMD